MGDTLRTFTMRDLLAKLARQKPSDGTTWGTGICGHNARGSGFCADCIKAEIARRENGDG